MPVRLDKEMPQRDRHGSVDQMLDPHQVVAPHHWSDQIALPTMTRTDGACRVGHARRLRIARHDEKRTLMPRSGLSCRTLCEPTRVSVENDPWWEVLLSVLSSCGEVGELEPHGLVVTVDRNDGTTTVVEIVMTPEEWDDLVSISWGACEPAARHVYQLVMDQPRDSRYLVYSQYQMVQSHTSTLPVDPGDLRLQELAAKYPDGVIPGGGWFAFPPEGRTSE